jgi:hypothetical protein
MTITMKSAIFLHGIPPIPHLSAKLADLQQLSCQEDGLPKLDTSKMSAFYDGDS